MSPLRVIIEIPLHFLSNSQTGVFWVFSLNICQIYQRQMINRLCTAQFLNPSSPIILFLRLSQYRRSYVFSLTFLRLLGNPVSQTATTRSNSHSPSNWELSLTIEVQTTQCQKSPGPDRAGHHLPDSPVVYANPGGFLKGSNAFSVTIHMCLCFYHKVFFLKERKREREMCLDNEILCFGLVFVFRLRAPHERPRTYPDDKHMCKSTYW